MPGVKAQLPLQLLFCFIKIKSRAEAPTLLVV
jgi:hypothetical protein